MTAESRPKIKLTKKQKGFADDYLDTGNGTLSAKRNYDVANEHVAAVIAAENLKKPEIRAYLEQNASAVASNMVRLALGAKKESDQIAAGKDVLDRAGYKPVEKSQSVNVHVDVPIESKTEAVMLAREYEERLRKSLQAKYAAE